MNEEAPSPLSRRRQLLWLLALVLLVAGLVFLAAGEVWPRWFRVEERP